MGEGTRHRENYKSEINHGRALARFAKERQKVSYEFRVGVNRVAGDTTGKVDKYSLSHILHQCFKSFYTKVKLIFS